MREQIPSIRLRRDIGNDSVVARDGVVICFFLRHSHKEVAPVPPTAAGSPRARA
jgi:hypothetical protein